MKQRLALTVGINDYPGTGSDLRGCVNDANDWRQALESRPSPYQVTTLLDSEATKVNVVTELEAMLRSCRSGDRVVFQYSGHGTWLPDRDGDEIDSRDEALYLYAAEGRGGLLTDDEIYALNARAPWGVRLTVVSDSCHSGSVTRFTSPSFISSEMRAQAERRIKFLPPGPLLDQRETRQAKLAESSPIKSRSRAGAILLSGCTDLEYSYDAQIDGRPRGAFTAAALAALPAGPVNFGTWHKGIRQILPSSTYPQTPQLGASVYQRYLKVLD